MKEDHHYILHKHGNFYTVEKVPMMKWAEWFESKESNIRMLGKFEHKYGHVSTVFLGLDHQFGDGPPLIFETMIFGGKNSDYCERYSTYDEAMAGHTKAINIVLNNKKI